MKKIIKNYITDAVLLILLGLILLIKPGATLEVSCRIIGAVLLVLGAVKLLQFFLTKDKKNRSIPSLIIGVVQILLGICLLASPGFFISFVPTVAAIVIAYGAIVSLIQAIRAKKHGAKGSVAAIVLALITLALAVIVILHPAAFSAIIMQIIGVSLIVEGVTLIISLSR